MMLAVHAKQPDEQNFAVATGLSFLALWKYADWTRHYALAYVLSLSL